MTKADRLDFSPHGYTLQRELGHNRNGGRVTYLATQLATQQPVVIKQFQFAQIGANWSGYDAHEREIALLQRIQSPHIPRYLDAFETPNGFCLVQEYKDAPSLTQLAQSGPISPQAVQQIATAILEILVDLQRQNPPIIHRDIKPENLLIAWPESDLFQSTQTRKTPTTPPKVYLVDFGLAEAGERDVAVSSMVKGTLGFMPPEQLFNRRLTVASDLYSLGVTLVCLLTGTKSIAVGDLINEAHRIPVRALLPQLDSAFLTWLEKLVAPNLKQRYPDAATALRALQGIKRVRRRSLKPVAIAAGLGLSLGLGLGWVSVIPLQPLPQTDARRQLQETGRCSGCDLRGVNLQGADLRGVVLENANLTRADLSHADLRGAYLENANLTNANLTGTNLQHTDLRGAILPDQLSP